MIHQKQFSKPVWPNEKKFAVCLTHDVDRVKKTYQYITRFIKFLLRFEIMKAINEIRNFSNFFGKFEKDPYWRFDRILEIEKKYNVKSTFFFLDESKKFEIIHPKTWKLCLGRYDIKKPNIIKIIRRLDSEGWEIGLHASYESFQNKNLLKKEKNNLENILGKKIHGIRQHYLNLEIPTTWIFQKELGFKYDSSFSYRNQTEYRKTQYFPFFPFGYSNSFLVIPLSIMDADLISYETDQNNIWFECIEKIESVEKKGGVLTINWHQEMCNDVEFLNNFSNYEAIIKLCLEKNAWITNAYEIYTWIINERIENNAIRKKKFN